MAPIFLDWPPTFWRWGPPWPPSFWSQKASKFGFPANYNLRRSHILSTKILADAAKNCKIRNFAKEARLKSLMWPPTFECGPQLFRVVNLWATLALNFLVLISNAVGQPIICTLCQLYRLFYDAMSLTGVCRSRLQHQTW